MVAVSRSSAAPDHVESVVIAGLDPAIHPLSQEDGCAGQARAVEERFNLSGTALVPLHSDFDRLDRRVKVARAGVSDQRALRCCGGFLGCLLMKPARSSVNTIL